MATADDEAVSGRSVVEWSSSVRPLLAASYASFDARDIPQLVASIVKSEAQILHHDKAYEPFYSSFVALSAHYIASVCSQLPSTALPGVGAACRILVEFCLLRLEAPDEACAVSQKHLILLIKAMCTGSSELDRTEIITFTAMMKSARLPLTIKTLSDAEEQKEAAPPPSVEAREREVHGNFFRQLGSPLSPDLSTSPALGSASTQERSAEGDDLTSDPYAAARAKAAFTALNVASLQELGGAEKLLRVCLNLPYFLRYINRFQDSVAAASFFIMPATVADATAVRNGFHSLVIDVTMALDTLSLPILEPLTPTRLQGLTLLALSCLYA
ncbi:E3 ubiquitin-protein ligase UBR4-like, partial [Lampetra fluviatilis]